MRILAASLLLLSCIVNSIEAYTTNQQPASHYGSEAKCPGVMTRRGLFSLIPSTAGIATGSLLLLPNEAQAAAAALQDSLDVDTFLKTGMDTGGNMGVSSQAGKSRPQTGVVLRDGSDVFQDKQGNVLSEILTGTKANPVAVVATFQSPWKLETGPVFDVECRDGRTGDGAFLAVSGDVGGKRNVGDLSTDFLLERLFRPEARFSFYGPPTDIKVKSNRVEGNYRFVEVGFSTLSQSTNAELPRNLLVATIPEGTNNAHVGWERQCFSLEKRCRTANKEYRRVLSSNSSSQDRNETASQATRCGADRVLKLFLSKACFTVGKL